MKDLISIIIVHWNTPELLKKQLSNVTINNEFQVIVVDNASSKSLSWLRTEFPEVILIENRRNFGFAFAANRGVMHAVGEWLLFLNPDVTITQNKISQLVDYAVKQKLDAGSPNPSSASYQKPLPTWLSLLVEFSPLSKLISLNVFKNKTLFGGCLLIRRNVLKTLGGWDERFFVWFEDSDLTQRLIQNKFNVGWLPTTIKHQGGVSFNNLDEQFKRDVFFHSMDVFARKHFSIFGKLVVGFIKHRYSKRRLLPGLFPGVSLTIPNVNAELLESFLKRNAAAVNPSEVEWIMVTSSIENKTVWDWRKKYPTLRFILIERNYGFASTANIGFRASTGTWVATANDDALLTTDWIQKCLSCSDERTGSVNPIIRQDDGEVETAGIDILPIGKARLRKQFDTHTLCYQVDATNAAAVIYSKEALSKVQLFDEKFGSYLEDIDLSLRLTRNGYKNIVSTTSQVTHIGHQSSTALGSKKYYLDFKNWLLVIIKNWGLWKIIKNFPFILLERLRNISGLVRSLS